MVWRPWDHYRNDEGKLCLKNGMQFENEDCVAIGDSGRHWCFISRAYPESSVNIVGGMSTIRARYTTDSKIVKVFWTAHDTVLVRLENRPDSLTEIDLDGNVLRDIAIPSRTAVVCSPKFIITVKSKFDVYDYKTGELVCSSDIFIPDVIKSTLQYSTHTGKLYLQASLQMSLQAFVLREDGRVQPEERFPICGQGMRIGTSHWVVLGDKECVVLDDYSQRGIQYLNSSIWCEPCGIGQICVIEGGFFLKSHSCCYFVLDRFSFTYKKAFLMAVL